MQVEPGRLADAILEESLVIPLLLDEKFQENGSQYVLEAKNLWINIVSQFSEMNPELMARVQSFLSEVAAGTNGVMPKLSSDGIEDSVANGYSQEQIIVHMEGLKGTDHEGSTVWYRRPVLYTKTLGPESSSQIKEYQTLAPAWIGFSARGKDGRQAGGNTTINLFTPHLKSNAHPSPGIKISTDKWVLGGDGRDMLVTKVGGLSFDVNQMSTFNGQRMQKLLVRVT